MAIEAGQQLLHYRLIEKIGQGGMGVVWRATDTTLDREVAIKVLPEATAADADRLRRFRREAKAVAALNHPNIVTIYSVESERGRHFLTMELVEGTTLDRHIPADGLAPEKILDLAIPLVDALAEAHARGITHRDLKPANVMVNRKGQVKILDFGLAKLVARGAVGAGDATATVTQDGLVVGTMQYMSPEQAKGEPADHRSDVFSLGVVLFELATGRRPFEGKSSVELLSAVLKDDPPSVTEVKSELPNRLGCIVQKCLEKDPDRRYQAALDVRNELQGLEKELERAASRPRGSLLRRLWVPAAVVAAAVAWWTLGNHGSDVVQHPAGQDPLVELSRLVTLEKYPEAFLRHRQLEPALAKRPEAVEALERSSQQVTIRTLPDEAEISVRPYGGKGSWFPLGRTPLEGVVAPRGFLSVKIERKDRAPPYLMATALEEQTEWRLSPEPVPEGMTWVPPGSVSASSLNRALPSDPLELPGFYIDLFEVTNQEYRKFVEAGGYREPQWWPPFVREGVTLPWKAGIAELVDRTGRPGPAGWELSSFPEGESTLPVTGISWFEAAAYAAWKGKELPTIYHWVQAAQLGTSQYVVPTSNFGGSLLPTPGERGLGAWGTRDLAGNAKEWSRSETAGGERLLLGGSWNEPSYNYFSNYDQRSPWERYPEFGLRCIREADEAAVVPAADARIETRPQRDLLAEVPVDDATFEIYRSVHEYERRPLEPEGRPSPETSPHWTRLDITVDAGHGDRRLPILLYLPKAGEPPYQVAVLFAGANAFRTPSSAATENLNSFDAVDFLIRSGRAVAVPVLLGMYERQDGYRPIQSGPIADRDHILVWSKELRRAVDYLVTRDDLDSDRMLYVGSSLGGIVGPVILALEPRFSAAYLRLAGLMPTEIPGEADPLNFAPRVKIPVLILNGRYDRLLPLETAQRGLVRALGTPEEDKQVILFDVGHAAPSPRSRAIKEVLGWADRVLGAVR